MVPQKQSQANAVLRVNLSPPRFKAEAWIWNQSVESFENSGSAALESVTPARRLGFPVVPPAAVFLLAGMEQSWDRAGEPVT